MVCLVLLLNIGLSEGSLLHKKAHRSVFLSAGCCFEFKEYFPCYIKKIQPVIKSLGNH